MHIIKSEKQFLVHDVGQTQTFFSNENMLCRVTWISMTFVIFRGYENQNCDCTGCWQLIVKP